MKIFKFKFTLWAIIFFGSFLFYPAIIFAQPGVVTQPHDTAICVESSAHFDIIAVNTSAYQWQENDGVGWYDLTAGITYVSGQFTPHLQIIDANLGLNGYKYRCVVTDGMGNYDTSDFATLGVFEPPVITQDPIDQTVCKNDIALFSTEAINGTSYQWQENTGIGWLDLVDNSFYTGTQTPDLSVYTTTGMDGFHYRCVIQHVSCPDTTESATLYVSPTPVIYTVTGGGNYCEGGNGVEVGLSGSEIGISYNLELDSVQTGVVVEGTGSAISFGEQSQPGIYTVEAYNSFSGCTIEMSGQAIVEVDSLPADFPVHGGGSVCEGDTGPDVFLLQSEQNIVYDLYLNGQFTGSSITGTGYSISFGSQNSPGYYTVIANNTETGCSRQMTGASQVIINAIPQADAGNDQFINQGDIAQLSGNATGGSGDYTYSWEPGALCVSPSSQQTGTIPLYVSTIFTLEVTDNTTGCGGTADSAIVYVSNGPLNAQALADKNVICLGENVQLLAVPGGGTGNYSYIWHSSPPGFSSTLKNPTVTPVVSTVYFLEVTDGVETVYDSVSVSVSPLPAAFNVTGGGNFCEGSGGPEITLTGSEQGKSYVLYRNLEFKKEMTGSGQPLNFGSYNQNGNYYVVANDFATGCQRPQHDTVLIMEQPLPVANAGPDVLITTGQHATLTGSASGGSGSGYQYSWTPADSLLNPSSASPATVPLYRTNLFQLTVTDNNGCQSNPDDAVVFVSGGAITVNIAASPYPKCPGEEVQLFALASGGSGSFSYQWRSHPAGFSSSVYNPIVTPQQNTWYIVTVNDGFGSVSDSIYITVNPSPLTFTLAGGGTVCEGNNPQNLTLSGSQQQVSYSLMKNGLPVGYSLTGTGYSLDFGNWQENGTYTVEAVGNLTGCSANMSGSASVIINPLPVADAGPDQTITSGTGTTLSGNATGGSGNYSYLWEPSALCQTPLNQNTATNILTQTTAFALHVTDNQTQCNSVPDTTIIYTNNGNLFANATASTGNICSGSSVQLEGFAGGGTGNYNYSWNSNPPGFYSQSRTPEAQPQVNTTYYLDVFDGLNHAYDSVFVQVQSNPAVFNLTGGGGYCDGDTGPFIGLSGSMNDVQYTLYRQPNVAVSVNPGNGQAFHFGRFDQPGTYYATAENSAGCTNTMTGEVTVIQNMPPIPNAGSDQSITYGGQAVLDGSASGGSGNYIYLWSPADSLINPSNAQAVTNPLHKTNVFNLEVEDANTGCGGLSDQTIVFVSGGPLTIDVSSSDNAICPGDSTQLFALASGGSGNYVFTWTSQPPGFTSTGYNPIVSPGQTTTYTVLVNDGITTVSDSVTITVNPLPAAFSLTGGGAVCDGDDPQNILLQNSEQGIEYTLLRNSLPTGITKTGNGYAIDFGTWNQNGTYTVSAINNYTQCSNSMANAVTVQINPLPVANAGPDISILTGQSTVLNGSAAGGSGSYGYEWEPSYLCITPLNQNTQTTALGQSTIFTLEVTDLQTQCRSLSDSVTVFTTSGNLTVRAVASPGSVCLSEEVSLFAIPSGGSGNYSYTWTSSPAGYYSQNANPQANPQVSTTYYIDVFDGLTHAYDSVYVVVSQNPVAFNITGGGDYCDGSPGPEIGLSSSENGVTYSLFKTPGQLQTQYTGSGQSFQFGRYEDEGDYFVTAVNTAGCSKQMTGIATVTKNLLPVAEAGDNQTVSYKGQAVLQGSATGGSGTYQYFWSPADSLLTPGIHNPVTVPLHQTNVFTLQVTDGATGCTGTSDQTVVFVSGGPLALTVQQSAWSVCPGEEVQLFALASGGTGNYSYIWTSNPPGFTSTVYNPIVTPAVTTTYQVTLNDGSNQITKSLTVNVNPLPTTYQVSGGGTVCQGTDPADILLSGSETGVSYELLRDGMQTGIIKSGSGFMLNFGTLQDEGSYTVFAINDTTGCTHTMSGSAVVAFQPVPEANAGPDVTITQNEPAVLNGSATGGSGAYGFSWSPGALCITPNNANTQTQPLAQTTLFRLDVTDLQTQCAGNADSVIVYVTGSTLSAVAGASTTSVCMQQPVSLLVLASGGTGTYTYLWTSSPAGFISNLPNPEATPVTTTTYYVDVFDGINHAFDSITVEVTGLPQPFIVTGGGTICEGDNGVVIGLNGSEQNVDYNLYNQAGTFIQGVTGTGQPIDFGVFTEQGIYQATAIRNGCSQNMNGEATVTVNEVPIVNAGNDITIEYGNQTTLHGTATRGSGIYTFHWTPVDSLVNPNTNDPLTQPLHKTNVFTAHATDFITGCEGLPDESVVFVSGGPLTVDIYASLNNLCPGETTQLFAMPSGGTGNYEYSWVSIPSGFQSTVYNPQVSPFQTTTYKILINDGVDIITDSIIINVLPGPSPYLVQGGGSYCEGGQGVEITLSGSEQNILYSLESSEGSTGIAIPGTGNTLSFGNLTEEAAYWVFAQNQSNGCGAYMEDTVFVQADENPQVSAGPNQYILSGNTATLEGDATGGSGSYGWLWSPEYLLQDPTLQNPQTIPLEQSAQFLVTASDVQTGCTGNTDSVIVFVTDGPLSVRVSANPSEVCSGDAVQLNALVTGGNGNYSILWSSNPEGFYANTYNPTAYPETDTWYYATVTATDSVVTDSVFVTVNPQPQIFNVMGGGELCFGDTEGKEIQLSGSETGFDYMLYRNESQYLSTVAGTGNTISFGNYTQQGTYTVYAHYTTGSCEKKMNGSAVIVVNNLPVAHAGQDVTVSSGGSVTLHGDATGGSGNYLYQWTPVNKLLNPTQQDPTTVPLNATTLFTLNVTDAATGCENLQGDDVAVFVTGTGSLSLVIIAEALQVCPGSELKLTALPTGGDGNYTYYWHSDPEGLSATGGSVTVYPETGTRYIVTVSSAGLSVTDSVFISVYNTPEAFAVEGGGGYCPEEEGVDISLSGSEIGTSYTLFRNNNQTGIAKQGNGMALDFGTFRAEGTYTVTAINQHLCRRNMSGGAVVEQYEKPERYQLSGGGNLCDNDPSLGILLESSQQGVKYDLYRDNQPTGISLEGNGLPLSFTGLMQTGTYTMAATNITTGCFNSMMGAVGMIIRQSPVVTITGDSALCHGYSTVLTAVGGTEYLWNTTPQQTTPSITVTPDETTVYTVYVSNTEGCITAASKKVTVHPMPGLTLDNDLTNFSLICYPEGLAGYSFFTQTATLQEGTSNELYYGNLTLSADTVYVAAITEEGCSDTVSAFVRFSEPPNAFTPDNNGKNDIFMKGFYIIVYNRWGKELYRGDEGWDGKYNGKTVTPGTYYYVHPVYDQTGNLIETRKGSVTVVKK